MSLLDQSWLEHSNDLMRAMEDDEDLCIEGGYSGGDYGIGDKEDYSFTDHSKDLLAKAVLKRVNAVFQPKKEGDTP